MSAKASSLACAVCLIDSSCAIPSSTGEEAVAPPRAAMLEGRGRFGL